MSVTLRVLELEDAEAAAAIYNSAHQLATFDEAPTPPAEFEADFRTNLPTHPGIAIEDDWKLWVFVKSERTNVTPGSTVFGAMSSSLRKFLREI